MAAGAGKVEREGRELEERQRQGQEIDDCVFSTVGTCGRIVSRAGHSPPRQWPWLPVKALDFITGCNRVDTYNG